MRNLAITILRLAGYASIAAALRHHARRPDRPLRTIMNCCGLQRAQSLAMVVEVLPPGWRAGLHGAGLATAEMACI